MSAAQNFDRQNMPGPGDLLVRPDGSVEYASENGREWLERQGFSAALRQHVADFDGGGPARPTLAGLRAAEARFVRLDADRRVRYLVTLVPASPLWLPATGDLTARQTEVAKFAAAGATVDEIAATLGISPNTVKDHLRKIYATLNVADRLELRDVLATP